MSLLQHTQELLMKGTILGIDEVGRGCLAGPVVAACVAIDWQNLSRIQELDTKIPLRDSKKMTRKQRKEASEVLREAVLGFGIGEVSAQDIDEMNILQATFLAMKRAVDHLAHSERVPDLSLATYLIDGNAKVPGVSWNQTTVIGGDDKIFSIAAASILAKEYRDSLLEEFDTAYPEYGFAQHKGYGTKLHYAAIAKHGITPLHRKTFLKAVLH